MAAYSAKGPTSRYDVRIKPDILAVGDRILSARSDGNLTTNQCSNSSSMLFMGGTSMACPMVSGAAALVRQYFEEGFHVNGSKNVAQGTVPSAALVKAMILSSGRKMAFPKNKSPASDASMFPNFQQGHGRMQLSDVLWFGAESGFNLTVRDRQVGALGPRGAEVVCCLVVVCSSLVCCLFVCLFVCLFACLFVCLFVCLFLCYLVAIHATFQRWFVP